MQFCISGSTEDSKNVNYQSRKHTPTNWEENNYWRKLQKEKLRHHTFNHINQCSYTSIQLPVQTQWCKPRHVMEERTQQNMNNTQNKKKRHKMIGIMKTNKKIHQKKGIAKERTRTTTNEWRKRKERINYSVIEQIQPCELCIIAQPNMVERRLDAMKMVGTSKPSLIDTLQITQD